MNGPVPPAFLFCGSHTWGDSYIIDLLVKGLMVLSKRDREHIVIVEGECPDSADTIARDCANNEGIEVRDYPADWDRYGKKAGPIRNQAMLDGEFVKIVFAFSDDFVRSKGTKDMVRRAMKAGIPAYIVRHATKEDVE